MTQNLLQEEKTGTLEAQKVKERFFRMRMDLKQVGLNIRVEKFANGEKFFIVQNKKDEVEYCLISDKNCTSIYITNF